MTAKSVFKVGVVNFATPLGYTAGTGRCRAALLH